MGTGRRTREPRGERDEASPAPPSRRGLLRAGGAVAVVAGAAAGGLSLSRRGAGPSGAGPGAELAFITPTESFYRYRNGPDPGPSGGDATLLVGPHGAPRSVPWSELLPLATRSVLRTLQCDGNGYIDGGLGGHAGCQQAPDDDRARPRPVNWDWRYGGIGTAEWQVLGLAELFAALELEPRGRWLSVAGRDGYRRSFPLELLGEDLLVAVGMNGEPLPHDHGAPARLLAGGQYGAMNVKWLSRLTYGDRDETHPFDGGSESHYGVKPIAFASLPRDGARVSPEVTLAGAAYAGRQAVKEVRLWLDPGESWAAELVDPPAPYVWSRWRSSVVLPPGRHTVTIACVDALGRYSYDQRPYGDAEGYGGYHRLELSVG